MLPCAVLVPARLKASVLIGFVDFNDLQDCGVSLGHTAPRVRWAAGCGRSHSMCADTTGNLTVDRNVVPGHADGGLRGDHQVRPTNCLQPHDGVRVGIDVVINPDEGIGFRCRRIVFQGGKLPPLPFGWIVILDAPTITGQSAPPAMDSAGASSSQEVSHLGTTSGCPVRRLISAVLLAGYSPAGFTICEGSHQGGEGADERPRVVVHARHDRIDVVLPYERDQLE